MALTTAKEEGDLTPLERYEFEYNVAKRGRGKFNQRRGVVAMQQLARLSQTAYSQIRQGKTRASPEQCLAFARYFDRPVEQVLKDFGYPYVDTLIVAVEARRDLDDQEYILKMLKLSRHVSWQMTDWRESPYKEHAEFLLTRNADPIEKARLYADEVWGWVWALEKRNVPRAQRNSDDALAVVNS